MSFAQFDDICEICFGMMEEDEELSGKERTKIEKTESLIRSKKRKEETLVIKEKQRQLIYK